MVLHSIALAILLGCNPVHVIGMDLDYKLGYATNTGGLIQKIHMGDLEDYRDKILSDLKNIRESAQKIGVRIINLNRRSSFDVLETGELV